jgi:AAA15 family ATPase/GTPase
VQGGGSLPYYRQYYIIAKSNNQELKISKLMLKHKVGGGEETLMDTAEESDGTLRLMDIIPILYKREGHSQVFIIDELDRNLHPNLCYQLIQLFLVQEDSNSQLIVTTHESNLLTFNLLRRDEIWFVEKDPQGASVAYSLEEFTPRYDKDIQKGYILGRFGAIPIIGKKPF